MKVFRTLVIIDLVIILGLFLALVYVLFLSLFKLLMIFGGLLFLFILLGYILTRVYKGKQKKQPDIIDLDPNDTKEDIVK